MIMRIKKGQPYPLGATRKSNGINFSMVNSVEKECGIILYNKKTKEEERIPFDAQNRVGNISSLFIEDIEADSYEYNYYVGEDELTDPYAKRVCGNEVWQGAEKQDIAIRGGFYQSQFDWQRTGQLHIPYQDSILYCLHVRGFTKHKSSKVKHKGTFKGLVEKLDYLKELGITGVELLPIYEFEECETGVDVHSMEYQVQHIDEPLENLEAGKTDYKLNYWGFKKGWYFAPKASYAAGEDACVEFKELVREFHKNGLEVILQFYFPKEIRQAYILEVLKHWVLEYKIDGFHLKGAELPVTLIATEPIFANTKIMSNDFNLDEIYDYTESPRYKNLAYYREDFMRDARRFLKGDEDMLKGFRYHMSNQNPKCGIVHFITNYYGFTLNDLVSYDRKHNEANGEENQDGTDYNYSWNCGAEGITRKKQIIQLRKKQIKNALSFLMTAQATPLLLAGDEFCNSQQGNNNAYCQDNEITWLDWSGLRKNQDIFEYVKALIAFRKAHPILHTDNMLTMMDKYGYGYPDLSYHGEEAWRIGMENYNRHIAMMYYSRFAGKKEQDDFVYLAYNMHWEAKEFALPALPKGYQWECVFDTADIETGKALENGKQQMAVEARSVKLLCAGKMPRVKRGKK